MLTDVTWHTPRSGRKPPLELGGVLVELVLFEFSNSVKSCPSAFRTYIKLEARDELL